MRGSISEEALAEYSELVSEKLGINFSEGSYDFTRCMREDGSFYGTDGTCKKGTAAGDSPDSPVDKKIVRQMSPSDFRSKLEEAGENLKKAKSDEQKKKAKENLKEALKLNQAGIQVMREDMAGPWQKALGMGILKALGQQLKVDVQDMDTPFKNAQAKAIREMQNYQVDYQKLYDSLT